MTIRLKKGRLRAVLAVLALCLGLLSGCGAKAEPAGTTGEASQIPQTEPAAPEKAAEPAEQEPEAPAQEAPAEAEIVELPDAFPMEFTFCSGAGGWRTYLILDRDGSFTGEYTDSEMGDQGEGYPSGSVYICTFSGRFGDFRQTDNHTYAMALEELTSQETPGSERIEDGIRYVASEAYGLAPGNDFLLYTPKTPTAELPEDFLIWWPNQFAENTGTLNCWGIRNLTGNEGFFTYQ